MATVRKRGNSYQIRVSCGTDVYGKKLVESMTWKPDENMTERQIQKELNKIAVQFEEKVKRGSIKKDSKMKINDLCAIYLDMQKKSLSPTTYDSYETVINIYILPLLGHLKLADVTPLYMQKFIYTLSEQQAHYGNNTLSASTVKRYYAVVQSIFKFACKMGFLEHNPSTVNNLELPKISPPNIDILDEKTIAVMLECLENEPTMWKVLIHLALCTGCRCGEIAALQWDDIIWEKNQIKICKSMYHINGEKGIKLPKSQTSNRTIVIPQYMIQMLKYYKNRQAEIKLWYIRWNKDNMIFINQGGDWLSPRTISFWFQNFLKRYSIKHIKFHALRHTSATLLLANGTNIKTVSNRLGHSSISITETYLHALETADISAAETLEKKLNFDKVGQKKDKKA